MRIERGGFKSLQPKPCDSCKLASAALFCRQDSAFLCIACDSNIHCATKLASSPHERVWMCQVCEHAPAAVTCKADAAALCVTCDSDIHSANPLSRRHERVAVEPFFDAAAAAAWLIPNAKLMDAADVKSKEMFFSEMDPFLDFFDYSNSFKNNDRVVPVQTKLPLITNHHQSHTCCDISSFTYPSHSLTQSVSSSSLDVGVVPDGNTVSDVSYSFGRKSSDSSGIGGQGAMQMQLCEMDREARVLRYREKRKNRKFHKTIRYASRKAYAETRPRIKGRFAKRTEVDRLYSPGAAAALMLGTQYGVVPSF